MNSHSTRTLAWPHGTLKVQSLGAMIGPVDFLLPDGRQVSPLHVAPWADAPPNEALPGILQKLRGEWPCVPFGYSVPVTPEMPEEWASLMQPADPDEEAHGHSSNHPWDWCAVQPDGALALEIHYPSDQAVRKLTRIIRPDPRGAAIDFTLRIETRAACRLPLGLHFTFRLPEAAQAAQIETATFQTGRTYPGSLEAGASAFAIGRLFKALDNVPSRDGTKTIDASKVPLDHAVEELLQLDGLEGSAALANHAENWRAKISWDAKIFPSLLLWYSNRGRKEEPWNGRHLALGMEPICSPFGFGPATARSDNPISRSGTSTARAFEAGETFETQYRLSVESL